MRLKPNQLPRIAPCICTARKKYSEHVGSNRQPDPVTATSKGESVT
jgi:hypothetical protein